MFRIRIVLLMVFTAMLSCKNKETNTKSEEKFTSNTVIPVYKSSSVKDIDGNVYRTLEMCDGREWMIENLNVSRYRNGDTIPQVQDQEEWGKLKTGAWCYYENENRVGLVHGKLYNWYAVNDPRGLAPEGWHVPKSEEWTPLVDCLGGDNVAAGKMKEIGSTNWAEPNVGAVNTSGFNAVASGARNSLGEFKAITNLVFYWSEEESNEHNAWYRHLSYSNSFVVKFYNDKRSGFSVRCVKDL